MRVERIALDVVNIATSETPLLKPTRRLKPSARKVFEQVQAGFIHLSPSDAEQLTQYAEWSAIYADALHETQRHPTITVPVINRSTGNVVGEKIVRNPMFATLREAQQQVTTLGRRLLIDAHSADKRQRLLTKKARALTASEQAQAAENARGEEFTFTDEQIVAVMHELTERGDQHTGDELRQGALCELRFAAMIARDKNDPEMKELFA
jgi:phage terminase small subunit